MLRFRTLAFPPFTLLSPKSDMSVRFIRKFAGVVPLSECGIHLPEGLPEDAIQTDRQKGRKKEERKGRKRQEERRRKADRRKKKKDR